MHVDRFQAAFWSVLKLPRPIIVYGQRLYKMICLVRGSDRCIFDDNYHLREMFAYSSTFKNNILMIINITVPSLHPLHLHG